MHELNQNQLISKHPLWSLKYLQFSYHDVKFYFCECKKVLELKYRFYDNKKNPNYLFSLPFKSWCIIFFISLKVNLTLGLLSRPAKS
jgi:hypothetical protein